jgi:hypothetical protein
VLSLGASFGTLRAARRPNAAWTGSLLISAATRADCRDDDHSSRAAAIIAPRFWVDTLLSGSNLVFSENSSIT